MEELLREHEELLANIPDGVEHDVATCPLCNLEGVPSGAIENEPGGGDMSKTYTEEELAAAIAEAVSPLQEELATIKASKDEAEIANRIAEAIAPLETAQAELQAALDAALVEADAAKTAHADLVAYLEAEVRAAELTAAYEAKKAERLEQVGEVANFTDEHKEANADRWTKMSDEDFAALISDWKEVATAATAKPAGETEKKIPATQMVASRSGGTDRHSAARQVMRATVAGNDPRTL